jgi:hypothetical protein
MVETRRTTSRIRARTYFHTNHHHIKQQQQSTMMIGSDMANSLLILFIVALFSNAKSFSISSDSRLSTRREVPSFRCVKAFETKKTMSSRTDRPARRGSGGVVACCAARQQPSSSSGGSSGGGGMIAINGDSSHLSSLATPEMDHPQANKEQLVESLPAAALAAAAGAAGGAIAPAPALSFRKFLTMQERRVVITIRYADNAGWKPYYLTATKKIKARHPDVLLERRVLPSSFQQQQGADGAGEVFEIAVDGKVIIGNQAKITPTRIVYCNMVELDLAIARARRRHRPITTYGIVSSTSDNNSSPNTKPPNSNHKR